MALAPAWAVEATYRNPASHRWVAYSSCRYCPNPAWDLREPRKAAELPAVATSPSLDNFPRAAYWVFHYACTWSVRRDHRIAHGRSPVGGCDVGGACVHRGIAAGVTEDWTTHPVDAGINGAAQARRSCAGAGVTVLGVKTPFAVVPPLTETPGVRVPLLAVPALLAPMAFELLPPVAELAAVAASVGAGVATVVDPFAAAIFAAATAPFGVRLLGTVPSVGVGLTVLLLSGVPGVVPAAVLSGVVLVAPLAVAFPAATPFVLAVLAAAVGVFAVGALLLATGRRGRIPIISGRDRYRKEQGRGHRHHPRIRFHRPTSAGKTMIANTISRARICHSLDLTTED